MTRLKVDDIKGIAGNLPQYDEELRRKMGSTLRGIACHGVGIREEEILPLLAPVQAAVVPIKSGKGIIEDFSQTVKAVLEHIGIRAFVTRQTDVAGIAEAFEKKVSLIFAADDNRFAAFNLKCCSLVDNAAATGKGFAEIGRAHV